MKKYTLYIMAVLALFASCSEEEVVKVTPTSGEEVKFSVGMDKVASRTLYGDLATDGKSIKVNWVDGDEITVYGTTCAVKRADYKVNTNGATDHNYADELVKTGAAGVQWGSDDNSDFYAIYPAVEGAFSEKDGVVTVTTKINEKQYANFELVDGVWKGTPFVNDVTDHGMENALMYAYANVNYSDNEGVVDLNFKPFSTVLKFTLAGWTVKDDSGLNLDLVSAEKVYVSKITLYAPDGSNVSGECDFSFTKGDNNVMTVAAEGGEYKTITLYPDYLAVGLNEKVEFYVFAIPQEYTMNSTDPWTVVVETSNFGTHSYAIRPTTAQTLVEGQIHNIGIPEIQVEKQFDLTEYRSGWMKYIPRNVYLSELSLPGAWYATNNDYQTTTTLSEQYAAGIRAFNIDCRSTADSYYTLASNVTVDNSTLSCAGTESVGLVGRGYSTGTPVLSALKTLSDLVGEHTDEYIVVVLTIAEKPFTSSSISHGTVNPSIVLQAIKTVLENTLLTNLYKEKITSETTVKDVLGKMIVKVNINTTAEKFTEYSSLPTYALLSQASMAADGTYISGDIVGGSFCDMQTATMYWGKDATGLRYYYHQAQRTLSDNASAISEVPNYSARELAINDIISQSKTIYDEGSHNGWFQLGIGGYQMDDSDDDEDRTTVASTLNTYVLDKINEKLSSSPSPVGLVLMNFCTDNTYQSVDLVDAIMTMNTKFYLNRNQEAEEWPDGNPFNPDAGEEQ